jgi:hypothetical protein
MKQLILGIALSLVLCSVSGAQEGNPQAPRSPELDILNKFAGTWKTSTVLKPSVWIEAETRIDGTRKAEWMLKNKFLKVIGKGGDVESREMNGFDQQRRIYTRWTFDTNGSIAHWRGRWSEKKKTMTWTLDAAGTVEGKMTEHFVSDDKYEITAEIRDNDGNLLMGVNSALTRVKEQVK